MSGSAGESGDAMLYQFRIANGLDAKPLNDLFVSRSDLFRQPMLPEAIPTRQDDVVVLLDDFSGTGKQVCDAWNDPATSFGSLLAGVGKVYSDPRSCLKDCPRNEFRRKRPYVLCPRTSCSESRQCIFRSLQTFQQNRSSQTASLLSDRGQAVSQRIWRLRLSGRVPAPTPEQLDPHSACRSLQVDRILSSTRLKVHSGVPEMRPGSTIRIVVAADC